MSESFEQYTEKVRLLLAGNANAKGYSKSGPGGHNPLYSFVREFIGGHRDAHALGEVVYKVVRYVSKGDPEDLRKASAWLFLVLQHQPRVPVDGVRPRGDGESVDQEG